MADAKVIAGVSLLLLLVAFMAISMVGFPPPPDVDFDWDDRDKVRTLTPTVTPAVTPTPTPQSQRGCKDGWNSHPHTTFPWLHAEGVTVCYQGSPSVYSIELVHDNQVKAVAGMAELSIFTLEYEFGESILEQTHYESLLQSLKLAGVQQGDWFAMGGIESFSPGWGTKVYDLVDARLALHDDALRLVQDHSPGNWTTRQVEKRAAFCGIEIIWRGQISGKNAFLTRIPRGWTPNTICTIGTGGN